MADPVARAAYDMAGKEEDRSVQNLIMADFLRAPSVDEIDLGEYDGQAGSRILIRASDDFDVTGVEVVISAVTGGEIERGAAIPSSTDLDSWVYTATASVPDTHVRVEVTAIDRPGHKTTKVENV